MAYLKLTRTKVWELNGSGEMPDANYKVSVNGDKYGRFGFDLTPLRTALGNRRIKVSQIQIEWQTSAKFEFNAYFNTTSTADGTWAGSFHGTSDSGMTWAGFSTYGTNNNALLCSMLDTKLNDTNENDVYFTLHKSGDVKGYGYCQWGDITVYFEPGAPKQTTIINDISSGSDVVQNGGEISYTIEAFNTQASKVTMAKVELFCVSGGTNIKVADDVTYSVNIDSFTAKSFSGKSTIYNNMNLPRGSQIKLKLTITGTNVSDNQTMDFVKLIDKYYLPSIKTFSLWRCSDVGGTMQRDDSGINLMTDLQIGLDAQSAGGFTLKAYYQENAGVDTSVSPYIDLDLATNFSALIAGVTDNTGLFEDYTFSNASAWFFKLVLSDGTETATLNLSVSKSFANMHLAGLPTGGVAFGMFSTSTGGENPEPKLESAYPIYAYGGIYTDVYNYSTNAVKMPYKWTNGKPIYRIVVNFTTTVDASDVADLSGLSIDKIISISGVIGGGMPIPFYTKWSDDDYISITFDTTNKKLRCKAASGYGSLSGHCILEYTKTTD